MLAIEGRQVHAVVENLSEIGALFQVTEPGKAPVTDDDLGKEAAFDLASFSPPRRYTGEIIRWYFADGAPRVAVRFWKKYEELPTIR
jgi:hypothetical protein